MLLLLQIVLYCVLFLAIVKCAVRNNGIMLIANGAEMKADYYPWKLEWEEDKTKQLK